MNDKELELQRVEGVSYRYPESDIDIINNINLSINKGEVLALTGPSGAGKTTLLRLLAAHDVPSKGKIYFHGQEMEGPELRLVPGYEEVRFVHQQFELRPNISAWENVAMGLRGFTRPYVQERVDELIAFFGLEHVKDHKPRALSGGQQQRVALARAISSEPEVLLMDEPFSALDTRNGVLLIRELLKLASEYGTAVVMITHDVKYALAANRIAFLEAGVLVQEGTPEELYSNAINDSVAKFFGETIDAQILGAEGGYYRSEALELSINNGQFPVEIVGAIFKGHCYQIEAKLIQSGEILFVDSKKRMSVGQKAYVDLKR